MDLGLKDEERLARQSKSTKCQSSIRWQGPSGNRKHCRGWTEGLTRGRKAGSEVESQPGPRRECPACPIAIFALHGAGMVPMGSLERSLGAFCMILSHTLPLTKTSGRWHGGVVACTTWAPSQDLQKTDCLKDKRDV